MCLYDYFMRDVIMISFIVVIVICEFVILVIVIIFVYCKIVIVMIVWCWNLFICKKSENFLLNFRLQCY